MTMNVQDNGFVIEEELKKLPAEPGVYLMHDDKDEIIYVGKARILKNRVRQYFQNRPKSPKIARMVSRVARFEYIVTDSELEALVLENNLIKEHRPRYNTLLKDDKTYPYIKVTMGEEFPRILFSRRMVKDKSRYFGPFSSSESVHATIDLLQKIYHIRRCTRKLPEEIGKERPCLYYHIHQCDAPCAGLVTGEEYRRQAEQAVAFLSGHYEAIMKELEGKMMAASAAMEFEKAIEYRELLNSVKQVAQKQKITSQSMDDRDVIALAREDKDAVVQVFFVRDGKLIGREHFHMNLAEGEDEGQILNSFVKQFYAGTPFVPHEIWVQQEIEDAEVVSRFLTARRGQRVKIVVPKKGEKERLVELAEKNAWMVLSRDKEKIRREEERTTGALSRLSALIGLEGISRLEAFDISHISGFETVASMVVFEEGKPKKSEYRKFKIRTVRGPDDYASMREVLERRFLHGMEEREKLKENGEDAALGSFTRFPDLLLMDGGRGQVNIALEVLGELGLNIPVCGMVKDDHHRTSGVYYNNVEVPIDRHSEEFRLVTRVQDEAHRFAIEFHRSLRGKDQVKSVLDDIPGIGPKRRIALLRTFKSQESIREASVEELQQAPGMNRRAAEQVFRFFHQDKPFQSPDDRPDNL